MTELTGFIGGGQMATALATGATKARVLAPEQLLFSEPSAARAQALAELFPGCQFAADNDDLLVRCSRVVLAVKPPVLRTVADELAKSITSNHLLVSIAAGIGLSHLQKMLGTRRVVRVMPNTPCQVGLGASAIATDDDCAADDLAWVEKLMASVGIVEHVPDELIHAVTGVAGSSPAYVYLVIEALSDGGVASGLSRDTATRLAAQAVMGAAQMVLNTGVHPGALKDQVTSPGGTTIAALRELEKAGTRSAFIEAVVQCAARSRELG